MSAAGLVEADKPSSDVGAFMQCAAACCCVKIEDRDTANEWMLTPAGLPPSLFERLCLCHCSAQERKPGGLEFDESLRGLAGVTLQDGVHSTAGSLQTLRWAQYDPATRTAYMKVFGGCGQPPSTGHWSEPVVGYWMFLINLARCAQYTYIFRFSEDKRYADIDIQGNPCCCCWCLPGWCNIPRGLVHYWMRQTEASKDGTEWERSGSTCGGEPVFAYNLRTIWNVDGHKDVHHERLLAIAPKQLIISH
eukprot:TRINITY_DN9140_c0_g1_i1.p1 TRINITY_DN9140_c0_g1~~TRINITY_DN9140_c0_g1_i1.p1  ORF type:complete len:249 (-),score=36.88 TRINITY_DN9140_c0_g1_i1:364-1110(-)